MQIKIFHDPKNNIYVVSANGKLMSPNEVEELTSNFRFLRDKNVNRVVLDLKDLEWMGSIGLGALITCVTTMRNAGGDVYLCNLNEKLTSIMSITQLDHVFRIFDSIELAVQHYNSVLN